MKNRTKILIALLGLSFTLTACSSASNTAQAAGAPLQKTARQQTTTTNTATTAQKNPTADYIQVFIDPNTGELVTIDPDTGEAVPYTAPATATAKKAASATVSGSQTAARTEASTSPAAKASTTDTQTADSPAASGTQATNQAAAQASQKATAPAGTQTEQAATQNNQTGSTSRNQGVDATTQATPTSTPVNQASLPNRNRTMAQAANSASYIGETRALQIAMDHAGVKSADVQFSYAKLDYDNGRWMYDAEFYAGNTEYDYEIDASTGAVLKYDYDMENNYVPQQQAQNAPAASAGTAGVSIETAKQTALARVSGATENNIRIYTDYDDGRMVYEGKIIYNAMEYEFEIDAATGNIIEWDVESVYD